MSLVENNSETEKDPSKVSIFSKLGESIRRITIGLSKKEVDILLKDAGNDKLVNLISNDRDMLIRASATNELIRRSQELRTKKKILP